MLIAPNPKKQFVEKYDLTNYCVQLSQGDSKKFYLYPLNEVLQLKTLRFVVESVDERARWYKALSMVMAENNVQPTTYQRKDSMTATEVAPGSESPREEHKGPGQVMEECVMGSKPVNLSTLTDISQFLSEQNNKLDNQISISNSSYGTLVADLD